jgi:hypothetical protein
MADFNIFGSAPEYLGGLLGEQGLQDLNEKARTTGLINAALGFIAQPRNQRYGSALPYIAKALIAGQEGAKGVYDQGLKGFEVQQKLDELKRKKEEQLAQEQAISQLPPNLQQAYRAFGAAAVPSIVKSQFPETESPFAKIDRKDYTTESFNKYLQSKNLGDLEPIAKEANQPSGTSLNKLLTERAALAQQNPNDPNLKLYDNAIRKETTKSEGINISYGAPQAGVDAQGNPVFFQPSKTGGAPSIVQGVAPLREEKPATESQAKAAAFGSQMKSASDEFSQIQKEGFAPGATTAQAQVELAGTPLRVFADPLAQRAQQSQSQWSEAYLRYKTGAAATEGEVKRNINTFFPKIGETDPKVIEQKARMRKQAEDDVLKSAKQPSQIKQPAQTAPAGRSRADILKQYGL